MDSKPGSVPVAQLRRSYERSELHRTELHPDPLQQFQSWLDDALRAQLLEPTAMTLATVGLEGRPSARIVLLKGIDARGFSFYTNYGSRKGRDLANMPHAALVFDWSELERQVRVEGSTTRLSREESERYFHSRPRGHQLGAWVSDQISAISGHDVLEQRLAEVESRFAGVEVPLPESWGGYVLSPDRVEFWQGRPNRLHDRYLYTRASQGTWTIEQLSP